MYRTRALGPAPAFSCSSPLALFAALSKPRTQVPKCAPAPAPCSPHPPETLRCGDVARWGDKRQPPTQAPGVLRIPPDSCLPTPSLERSPAPWYLLPSALLGECRVNATTTFFVLLRGVEPYDKPNTVYVERHEPSGASTVIRSTDFFQSRENKEIILEDVEDFQLRDKYMFATKSVVSITRVICCMGS